jgi:hypothetical protein
MIAAFILYFGPAPLGTILSAIAAGLCTLLNEQGTNTNPPKVPNSFFFLWICYIYVLNVGSFYLVLEYIAIFETSMCSATL